MSDFFKINAPEVLAIPIQENNEPLVDLKNGFNKIFVDDSREHAQKQSESVSFCRKNVAEKLQLAATSLPQGIVFKIIEGYRPVTVQQEIFEEEKTSIKNKHPDWNDQQVFEATALFIAPPDDTPPHSTGGAIDLTLMTTDGQELDMGNDLNAGYDGACYTNAVISDEARKNRNILIDVMQKTGFANYPAEWWHWSYGDRYWAQATGAPFAIYGSK